MSVCGLTICDSKNVYLYNVQKIITYIDTYQLYERHSFPIIEFSSEKKPNVQDEGWKAIDENEEQGEDYSEVMKF